MRLYTGVLLCRWTKESFSGLCLLNVIFWQCDKYQKKNQPTGRNAYFGSQFQRFLPMAGLHCFLLSGDGKSKYLKAAAYGREGCSARGGWESERGESWGTSGSAEGRTTSDPPPQLGLTPPLLSSSSTKISETPSGNHFSPNLMALGRYSNPSHK